MDGKYIFLIVLGGVFIIAMAVLMYHNIFARTKKKSPILERKYPILKEIRIVVETKQKLFDDIEKLRSTMDSLNLELKYLPKNEKLYNQSAEKLTRAKSKNAEIIRTLNEVHDTYLELRKKIDNTVPKKVWKKYDKILDNITYS